MKKKLLIIGLVLLLIGAGWFVFGARGDGPAQSSAVVQRVEEIVRGSLSLTVSANGVIQPINKVEVKSKGSGQIVHLNFEEGQSVRKGALLLLLDQTTTRNDYNQAAADLELQQATVEQQENNFRRVAELFRKNMVSQQELDQAKVARVSAKSQLVKAKAALSSAAERLRDTRIVAAVSGLILSKNVEVGQIISSGVSNVGGGTLIATIADMAEVDVQTNIDEVDIGKISVGQSAQVVADAYPDDKFTGRIERIAPLGSTTQNVTTFSVIVRVKNISGKLKAGMSASVDIAIFDRANVLLIPNDALMDLDSDEGKQLLADMQNTDAQRGGSDGSAPPDARTADNSKKRQDPLSAPPRDVRFDQPPPRARAGSPEDEVVRKKIMNEFEARIKSMTPEELERMKRLPPPFPPLGMRPAISKPSKFDTATSKLKIVLIENGDKVRPRLIRIGLSNYDYTEVLSGAEEGEQVQVTTVSRAKQSSDEMSQRFKAATSSGIAGAGVPPPP